MSPKEVRALLTRLGFYQIAACRLLGVTPRTMRGWMTEGENGRWIPEPSARLLMLMEDMPEVIPLLERYADQYESTLPKQAAE